MSKMLQILVLCGNGAVTSTVVMTKLKEKLRDNNVQATYTQKRVAEGTQALQDKNYDVVVSTAGQNFAKGHDVPVLNGIPFLTGIGVDGVISQIVEIANS